VKDVAKTKTVRKSGSRGTVGEPYRREPYHSWDKGLVENTNEKIRQYTPKKSDLYAIIQDQLTAIEVALNNRPKNCLGYRTPSEACREWIASQPSQTEVKDNTVAVIQWGLQTFVWVG
jgi:hypothetical protein